MTIHIVEQGETLRTIAARYGVSPIEIELDNRLTDPDRLVIGQTLVILGAGGDEKLGALTSNGYAYPFIEREVFNFALPYLSGFSSFAYGFNADGKVIAQNDGELVARAKDAGTSPILVLSTLTEDGRFSNELASTLLNSSQMQETLISDLLSVMSGRGFTGLDIDFEYVFPEDAEAFVLFVTRARERLNAAGYFVICALAPKTSDDQAGLLYEGHDYAGLGAAADYVLLMTYEWGYTFGPPMAVAPIENVRRVVEYGLSRIPAEKILMGVPNYGYDWTLPFVAGSSRARSIGCEEAVDIARNNGANISFDQAAQTPYFTYNADGADHVVWFEDARSIRAKLTLAAEYSLRGFSVWNLMRPFTQMWLVYSSLFDKRAF